ncbi:MAG TPA: hypothetical protein VGM77_02095 [Gemmatimonadales bacterium]|jgi:hypothetical protein
MRDKYRNPFDRTVPSQSTVSILVTPGAIESAHSEELALLASIAEFTFLDIAVASDDSAVQKTMVSAGCAAATFSDTNDFVQYEQIGNKGRMQMFFAMKDFAVHCGRGNQTLPPHRWIDRVLSLHDDRTHDYIVVSPASYEEQSPPRPISRIRTFAGLFHELRYVQVAQNNFEVLPRTRVNKGLYYAYRRHTLFREIARARLSGVPGNRDQVQSLTQRTELACHAHDSVAIASLRKPNNDTGADALFYLGYLFMLATGAHDDLAWLCNDAYGLGLHRTDIGLRQKPKKPSSPFRKAVGAVVPALAAFLADERARAAIDSLYPMRDALQHRTFPQPFGSANGDANTVFVPEESARLLAPFMPRSTLGIRLTVTGMGHSLPYGPLATGVMRALQHVVNGMLTIMTEHTIAQSTSTAAQEKRNLLLARLDKGPASFLQIGVPPLLL